PYLIVDLKLCNRTLQAIHEYWRSMNQYSKQILNKEKVA
ncbi:TPA: antitoxin, partial [Enterococcus faecium]|nr:antitoxin [Enterococcus faecium]